MREDDIVVLQFVIHTVSRSHIPNDKMKNGQIGLDERTPHSAILGLHVQELQVLQVVQSLMEIEYTLYTIIASSMLRPRKLYNNSQKREACRARTTD